jgi:IBR domain, a half RING-finger domain
MTVRSESGVVNAEFGRPDRMVSHAQREMVQDGPTGPSLRRRKSSAQPRHHKDKKEARTGKSAAIVDALANEKPADLEALRKARLDYISTLEEDRPKKMRYVGETITREAVKVQDVRHVHRVSASKRRRKVVDPARKHGKRKVRHVEPEAGGYKSVYTSRQREQEVRSRQDDGVASEPDDSDRTYAHSKASSEPVQRSVRRRAKTGTQRPGKQQDAPVEKQGKMSQKRQSEPNERVHHVRRNSYGIDECQTGSIHGYDICDLRLQKDWWMLIYNRNTISRRSPHISRPSLHRSQTTMRSRSDATKVITTRPKAVPSIAESHVKKGSSILSSFLRATPSTPMSLKKVDCLTCGADDVPIIKTAKLACSHRMCHDCLSRIFTMSVTDPAHMPPKCCTSEHIPLKHVDKLFDQKFKKTWNRKFQEYTTRNRIYCPTRHCGEWIKPNHISLENGRKVGKCKKCGTRVCCTCNNRMHTSRECPKDPATKKFVQVAKEEGWQRCFNCSAMVELKEGCNHMTCRCTAEFCMVCGSKWKTCDCPWFNYQAVEADRLDHMNIAQGRGGDDGRAPIRYQEEIDRRRQQERRDEALARRMQVFGVNDDPPEEMVGNANPGQMFGFGNGAGHFLNHNFIRILTGNFGAADEVADGLLNGAVTGRENPLPPAPFELDNPARDPTNQTAQLLRHDIASHSNLNNAARRRSNDQANPGRGHGHAAHRTLNDPAAELVPLPPTLLSGARRPTALNQSQSRRANGLAGLLAGGGRSQTADERVAEQRIQNWREEVPIGEPAGGVTPV